MNKYWLDVSGTVVFRCFVDMQRSFVNLDIGNNSLLWSHEWNKHGTCFSTLNPSCFSKYTPQQEVVAYFSRTVSVFGVLNSYKFLSNAGIVPSNAALYRISDV